jgi:PAS domain S-box-containing protein
VPSDLDVPTVLQSVVEHARAVLEARYAALGIVNQTGALVEFLHSGLSPDEVERIGKLPEGNGLLAVIIRENHAIRLRNLQRDPRSVGFPPHHPAMRSLLGIPIPSDRGVLGRLYFCDKSDGSSFDDDDERLGRAFAALAATAIRHAELLGDSLALRQAQDRIYDTVACAIVVREASGAISSVNAAAHRMFDALPMQLTGTTQLPIIAVATEGGQRLAEDEWPDVTARRTGVAVRGLTLQVTSSDGSRRWLHCDAVPVLERDGRVHQVVSSFIDITARRHAEDELRVLSARQEASIALEQFAIADTPFAELVERAAEAVARSLSVPFVKVLELLPDGETCVVTASVGWPKGIIGASVPLAETGECQLALRAGGPMISEDLSAETRFTPPAMVLASGARSGLCVAIAGRDRPLGTIDVHARAPRRFGDADVRYLQTVANVLASASRRELDERARLARSLVLGSLTSREREVLRLLGKGRNNREIAEVLGIQYSTVRGYVRAVIEKLGVRSKLEAVARANAIGLLPDS